MNEEVKTVIKCIAIACCILFLIYSCTVNIRLERKLKSVSESITSCQNTANELRDGIRQQELSIAELESITSRLSESLDRSINLYNKLKESESNVDGYTGALAGTIDNVTRTIELTLQGIEEEGISE